MNQQNIISKQKIIVILFSLVTASIFMLLYFLIPPFDITFKSFGTSLPLLTKCFLALIPAYIPLALLSLAPIFIMLFGKRSLDNPHVLVKLSVTLALLAIILLVVAIYAMYLPTFALGNTSA